MPLGGKLPFSQDVVIRNCISHDNDRQGISVISAVNLLVDNCVFSSTRGTAPEAGIDLEPDTPDQRLVNCVIRNCPSRVSPSPFPSASKTAIPAWDFPPAWPPKSFRI